MSSQPQNKTRVHLKRFKLKDVTSVIADGERINVLIVGTSLSRKTACAQDIAFQFQSSAIVLTKSEEHWVDTKFKTVDRLSESLVKRAKVKIITEELEAQSLDVVLNTGIVNIVFMSDYITQRTSIASKITHVVLLGGLTQLRNLWSDFGALIPKFKDFRQIYLACTDEGERYSDDFLIIRNNPSIKDPSEVFSWGSLHKDQVKDISIEIERTLVLAKVKSAQVVDLKEPVAKSAQVADTSEIPIPQPAPSDDSDANKENVDPGAPSEPSEREPRAECCIQ